MPNLGIGPQAAPIANQQINVPQDPQPVGNAAAQPGGIRAVVRDARPMPAPAPRAAEPAPQPGRAASIGRTVLRVLLGIGTLGLSEAVCALVRHASQAPAPAPQAPAPGLPAAAPQAAQFNQSIAALIDEGAPLPEAFSSAVREALDALREQFGDLVPQDTSLNALLPYNALAGGVSSAVSRFEGEITPPQLAALIKEAAVPRLRDRAVSGAFQAALERHGMTESSSISVATICAKVPGLREAVNASTDPASLEAAIAAHADGIERYAQRIATFSLGKKDAVSHAVTLAAQTFGMTEAQVQKKIDFRKLEPQIGPQTLRVREEAGPEEIRQACFAKATAFVEKKAAGFYEVDSLPLSAELRQFLQDEALSNADFQIGIVRHAMTAVSSLTPKTVDDLRALFPADGPAPSVEMVFARVQTLALELEETLVGLFGQQGWEDLGFDKQASAKLYAAKILFDQNPGLSAAFEAHPELRQGVTAMIDEEMSRVATINDELNMRDMSGAGEAERAAFDRRLDASILLRTSVNSMGHILNALDVKAAANAQIASALRRPEELPASMLAAFNYAEQATRLAFPGMELPDNLLDVYIPGRDFARNVIRNAVSAEAGPVTVERFNEIVQEAFRQGAAALAVRAEIASTARTMDMPISDANVATLSFSLLGRHPDVANALKTADGLGAVQELLAGLKGDVQTLVRIMHDIDTAWKDNHALILRTVAERTGLPEDEVRQKLNMVKVLGSGKFGYIQADILELCKNPSKPLASLPNTASIQNAYSSAARKFIDAKVGLYLAAPTFGLAPELAANWQARALSSPTLSDSRFFEWSVAAAGVDCSGVIRAAQAGVDNEGLYLLLHSVAQRLDLKTKQVLGDAIGDMGSDELNVINSLTLEAFKDRNPELRAVLQADQNKLDALAVYAEEQVFKAQQATGQIQFTGDMTALQAAKQEFNYCAKALSLITELGGRLPD